MASRVSALATHIANYEGYNKKGTLAQRQNNPGNLRFVGQSNSVKGDKGFAKFKTPEDGWLALQNQIRTDAARNLTLGQFVYKYAPPVENNSAAYLSYVANRLGMRPTQKLSEILK